MEVLHDISKAVVAKGKVSDLMSETLEILHVRLGLLRGTITLREADMLFIEASNGISDTIICEAMGHNNIATTTIYLAALDTNLIASANRKLIDTLTR